MKHVVILGIAAALVVALAEIGRAEGPGPAPEELFKKLDANSDGKLEAKEAEGEQSRIFERLVRVGDKDKDGTLTKDEFLESLKHNEAPVGGPDAFGIGGKGRRDFDPRRLFEMLDKNKDGKLTRDEAADKPRISAALEKLGKEELTADEFAKEVGKAMKKFRDGEGRPGRPEGREPEGRGPEGARPEDGGPGGPGHHGPNFMRVIDINKDGRLSRDELAKAADKFNELDENKDGELDPRELMGPPPEEMREETAGGAFGAPGGKFGKRFGRPQGPDGQGPQGEGPQRRGGPRKPGDGGPEQGPPGQPGAGGPPEGARRRGPEGFGGGPGGPGGQGREFVHRMFEQLDANDDGKISQDEAPAKMKQHFSQIDANGDGAIDERELAHARPGGKHGKGTGNEGGRPNKKRPDAEKSNAEKPETEKP